MTHTSRISIPKLDQTQGFGVSHGHMVSQDASEKAPCPKSGLLTPVPMEAIHKH